MSLTDLVDSNITTFKSKLSKLTLQEFTVVIANSPDLDVQNTNGYTSLHILCLTNLKHSRSLSKMRMLINAGADVNITNNFGEILLNTLYKMPNETTLLKMKLLIDSGININSTGYLKRSALCTACILYDVSLIFNDYKKTQIYYDILLLILDCPRLRIPPSGYIYDNLRYFKTRVYNLPLLTDAINMAFERSWYNSPRCIFITAALTLGEAESQASPFIMDLRQKALL